MSRLERKLSPIENALVDLAYRQFEEANREAQAMVAQAQEQFNADVMPVIAKGVKPKLLRGVDGWELVDERKR